MRIGIRGVMFCELFHPVECLDIGDQAETPVDHRRVESNLRMPTAHRRGFMNILNCLTRLSQVEHRDRAVTERLGVRSCISRFGTRVGTTEYLVINFGQTISDHSHRLWPICGILLKTVPQKFHH